MKARDVQAYLQSLSGDWQYPPDTVDTFKAGDPEAEITGIAVGWMSYTWALQEALELGCNMFITHEPTYYNHRDNDDKIFRFEGVAAKRQFIEDNGLVIVRCHDLWDQIVGIGIPDSWGRMLDLGSAVVSSMHHRVYEVPVQTASAFARHVATQTASLNQPAVQLIGPAEKFVRRVAIGTGAITPFLSFVEDYEIDLGICTDDGIDYWADGAFAIDMGVPLVVVNHMVAEEAGVESLARHLQAHFRDIPVHHIAQRCMYRLIEAEGVVGKDLP